MFGKADGVEETEPPPVSVASRSLDSSCSSLMIFTDVKTKNMNLNGVQVAVPCNESFKRDDESGKEEDLASIEEFYLREIEQQQNTDLMNKLQTEEDNF